MTSGFFFSLNQQESMCDLRSLTADTTGKLDILGHDRDTLRMNGAQVGVFKETNKVGIRGFLKGKDGRALEAKIGLEILSNLTDKALEGQLADEQIG